MSRFGHFPFDSDFYLHHLWDFPSCPRIFDQHFAVGVTDSPPSGSWSSDAFFRRRYPSYFRRPDTNDKRESSGVAENSTSSERFHVSVDVTQFAPDDLSVKTVDNYVVVSGKHEERADEHGWVSRQFTRRYLLPDDVSPDTVTSVLSRDGILTIMGPRKKLDAPKENERIIPILQMDNDGLDKEAQPSTSGTNV